MENTKFLEVLERVQKEHFSLSWYLDNFEFSEKSLKKMIENWSLDSLHDEIMDITSYDICSFYSEFVSDDELDEMDEKQKNEIIELMEEKIYNYNIMDYMPTLHVELATEKAEMEAYCSFWNRLNIDFRPFSEFCELFGVSSSKLQKIIKQKNYNVLNYTSIRQKRTPALSDDVLSDCFALLGCTNGNFCPVFLCSLDFADLAKIIQDGKKKEDVFVAIPSGCSFSMYNYSEGSTVDEGVETRNEIKARFSDFCILWKKPVDDCCGFCFSVYKNELSFSL